MYKIYFEDSEGCMMWSVNADTLEAARKVYDALVYAKYVMITERPQ